MQDYKILLINAGSFGISMTNIDVTLKIVLLLVTIGYTIQKWYLQQLKQKRAKGRKRTLPEQNHDIRKLE